MELPDYGLLSKWLGHFGENLAVGMILVVVYSTIRPALPEERARLSSAIIGMLFGLCAIISTSFPIEVAPGVLVDMRNVFILVGSLSGGPIGAVISGVMAGAYRFHLGGQGVPIGVGAIFLSASYGAIVALRFGRGAREFDIGRLIVIGVGQALMVHAWGYFAFVGLGLTPLPREAVIATLILYPATTALLGTAINLTHYRLLQHTQRRLVSLFETTSDLIWETDVSGKFTLISGRVKAVLGYEPAEMLGKANRDFALRWQDDATHGLYRSAIQAHLPFDDLNAWVRAKDGSQRVLAVSGRPAIDSRGRLTGFRGIAADITARWRAEAELAEREARLRDIERHLTRAQEVGSVASTEVDLRTGRGYWSDFAYRLFGLDPATTVPGAESFLAIVHPDDRAMVEEIVYSARAGRDTPPSEFRIIHPDGTVRWLHRVAELIRDDDGTPVRVIATAQDITDRKRVEADLRAREAQLLQSQEHLARAQHVGGIGSNEVDLRTGESWWSDERYVILGLDPETTQPSVQQFLACVHPDDLDVMMPRFERTLKGQSVEPAEYRIVRPDGEVRWIYGQSDVIRDADGVPVKVIGTMHDITDRKRAQLERSELERQLLQAQKMEAVGNLTGGIAHDFNNLLSVIIGHLELAADELADRPQVKEYIATCIRAARRGATLTRSMLAFSRQQPLQPVDMDVAATVGELMELLPRTLGETIELKLVTGPDLWPCLADPSQLQTALLNLALNARDAMPEGGALTIEIANARIDAEQAAQSPEVAPGDYVALAVSDTGTGMPPEVIERAFDPFFTTKDVGKGSGLGLSMVYGFAKQSGGHVTIESEVGRGTCVRLYLPRGHLRRPSAEAAGRRALRTGSGTILVVEDDQDVREMTLAMLKRLGYSVLAASDSAEALPLIEAHAEIDLLLTDIMLPGGASGRAIARKATEIAPRLKTIFMSGYAQDLADSLEPVDVGGRLLHKPFNIEQLGEMVRETLEGR